MSAEPSARWSHAVEVAARGRYLEAEDVLRALDDETGSWPSLALSARASLRRQVGTSAEATQMDSRAYDLARDEESRADAAIGLAADAVAVGLLDQARRQHATAERDARSSERTSTRWHWVGAEMSLLAGDIDAARKHADAAITLSRGVSARHTVKSHLIHAAVTGDPASLEESHRLIESEGWLSLAWPLALIAGDLANLCDSMWLRQSWAQGLDATYRIEAELPVELIAPWQAHPGVRRLRDADGPGGGG